MTTLADQTAELHIHPFTVGGAVLKAHLEFIKLHRTMKDVVLSCDEKEILEYLQIIQESEKKVLQNFEVIRERFLGDPAIVDEAFQAAQIIYTMMSPLYTGLRKAGYSNEKLLV